MAALGKGRRERRRPPAGTPRRKAPFWRPRGRRAGPRTQAALPALLLSLLLSLLLASPALLAAGPAPAGERDGLAAPDPAREPGSARDPLPARELRPPWILVDTRSHTLALMAGGRPQRVFPNISLGRGGVARLRHRGDGTTPLGEYHIAWINRNSRFHIFLGFDYPNADLARRGLEAGLIDGTTYRRILRALAAGRVPPQGTALGGYLGIHGLGRGDPFIHARFNWTQGCIALTNREIEELARRVRVGTRVLIR